MAEHWIEGHLAMPLSVRTLSSELAMSSKTLTQRIYSVMGISSGEFNQRWKLLHTVHLIDATSMSIEAIAEKMGY